MKAYLVFSSIVVSTVTLFLLVAVLSKGLRRPRDRTFCAFAFSVFVWLIGHLLWQLAETEEAALLWIRILVIGSAFIPYTYLHFVSQMTQLKLSALIYLGYGTAILLAGLAFTPLIVAGVEARLGFDYWPVAGPLFFLYAGGFFIVVTYCFYLLIRQFRSAPVKIRNQNKYLIIGTAVGFLGGSTNFPLWLNIPVPPWGHGLSLFYILGLGYSVLKYRLLDFNEMVVRSLGLLLLSAVLGGFTALCIYGLLGYVHPYYSSGFLFWWFVMSMVSFVYLLFVPYLTNQLNELIQARLVASRFSYRKELGALSGAMISDESEDGFIEAVTRGIYQVLKLDYAGIFIRSDFESAFRCKASEGEREGAAVIEAHRFEPLVKVFRGKRSIMLDEEMDQSSQFKREIQELLSNGSPIRSSDILISISAQESLYGFLVLGSSSYAGAFADVDLLLLENLCSRMGLALRSREVERLSNQVESLVALGTMAAGLSHELRNPLVSIRTLSSFLAKNPDLVKLSPEFRETVQRDVKRISGIIEGVAAFAHNDRRPAGLVEIPMVLREVEHSVRDTIAADRIGFKMIVGKDIPPVRGSFEQLIQVFQNIIGNAVQAITEWDERRDAPWIEVRVSRRGGGRIEKQRWVEVVVVDNGPGISREFQARIFDPFVTSRDTGMRQGAAGTGLGLAIASRIIELHQGAISVQSEIGAGAQFTVSIPCSNDS